jgi:hypothetical protein
MISRELGFVGYFDQKLVRGPQGGMSSTKILD